MTLNSHFMLLQIVKCQIHFRIRYKRIHTQLSYQYSICYISFFYCNRAIHVFSCVDCLRVKKQKLFRSLLLCLGAQMVRGAFALLAQLHGRWAECFYCTVQGTSLLLCDQGQKGQGLLSAAKQRYAEVIMYMPHYNVPRLTRTTGKIGG